MNHSPSVSLPWTYSTPAVTKAYATAPVNPTLAQSRSYVLQDLQGQVPEVEINWFLDNVLPPLNPRINLDKTYERLLKSGDIHADGHWSLWTKYPVSAAKGPENKLYQPFEKLASRIRTQSKIQEIQASAQFVCIPDRGPESTTRANASRPDCAAVRGDSVMGGFSPRKRHNIKWVDIAVPGEVKISATDERLTNDVTNLIIDHSFHTNVPQCRIVRRSYGRWRTLCARILGDDLSTGSRLKMLICASGFAVDLT
jgi:hypothetical protein